MGIDEIFWNAGRTRKMSMTDCVATTNTGVVGCNNVDGCRGGLGVLLSLLMVVVEVVDIEGITVGTSHDQYILG